VRVLVVNAGSSTLKLALIGDRDEVAGQRLLEAPYGDSEVRAAVGELPGAEAVGHRIVHGGERFTAACLIDPTATEELRLLSELAPLHQPPALAALELVRAALPQLPAVACFDTAFHATLSPAARTYALPEAWRERWPLRRFGFHGLSHAWVARRAIELVGAAASARIVSCHLGAGASLCAIADGRSVDTTMGFTPLEGLVMATRSGSVDPGLVLWLADRLPRSEIANGLEREGGMLGLAGSSDMREVLAAAQHGDERATLALDVYSHRLRAAIAAMAAALGGLDVLAFTGGVGENAPAIRARVAAGLGFLGVALDAGTNERAREDANVSASNAAVQTVVISAREDLEIARQTRATVPSRSERTSSKCSRPTSL
jgi:acetate kinase